MEFPEKVVYANIFEPDKSLFKSSKKDKATCKKITCTGYEQCGLYKRGECSLITVIGWHRCPYGRFSTEEGFTSRANAYSKWIDERKIQYKEALNKLKSHSYILTEVGDYVFLPYGHMTMNKDIPFLEHSSLFINGNCFLHKNAFTIHNIINICEFRPMAMIGGEITSYQNEEVPKFLKHLSEQMPEIFKELSREYERAKTTVNSFSHIGRKAYLNTLTPNIGEFVDCHKSKWIWDGTYLTSYNSAASFMLVNKFSELRIKPIGEHVVTITDNDQVNKDTKFVS